jgi:predicted RNA-binding Zn ribbon-like protein
MASFVANHQKKIGRLAKRVKNLRRLIKHGSSPDKLLKAALEIRDGRIRVLRAKQNQNPASAEERVVFLRDEEQIKAVAELTAEQVLAEYIPNRPTIS